MSATRPRARKQSAVDAWRAFATGFRADPGLHGKSAAHEVITERLLAAGELGLLGTTAVAAQFVHVGDGRVDFALPTVLKSDEPGARLAVASLIAHAAWVRDDGSTRSFFASQALERSPSSLAWLITGDPGLPRIPRAVAAAIDGELLVTTAHTTASGPASDVPIATEAELGELRRGAASGAWWPLDAERVRAAVAARSRSGDSPGRRRSPRTHELSCMTTPHARQRRLGPLGVDSRHHTFASTLVMGMPPGWCALYCAPRIHAHRRKSADAVSGMGGCIFLLSKPPSGALVGDLMAVASAVTSDAWALIDHARLTSESGAEQATAQAYGALHHSLGNALLTATKQTDVGTMQALLWQEQVTLAAVAAVTGRGDGRASWTAMGTTFAEALSRTLGLQTDVEVAADSAALPGEASVDVRGLAAAVELSRNASKHGKLRSRVTLRTTTSLAGDRLEIEFVSEHVREKALRLRSAVTTAADRTLRGMGWLRWLAGSSNGSIRIGWQVAPGLDPRAVYEPDGLALFMPEHLPDVVTVRSWVSFPILGDR